jgi:hypothetical protein
MITHILRDPKLNSLRNCRQKESTKEEY